MSLFSNKIKPMPLLDFWIYEGTQGYVYSGSGSGRVPLYRYWHSGIGDHFYTTNWGELGAGGNGWKYEGIQAYIYSSP